MEIVDFTKEYTAEARRLAAENYEEERGYVRVLPEKNEIPLERELTANGLGTAIVENGRYLGESPCFIMMDESCSSLLIMPWEYCGRKDIRSVVWIMRASILPPGDFGTSIFRHIPIV